MNIKRLIFLSCFALVVFSASIALAGGRAHSITSRPAITQSASRIAPRTINSPATLHQRNGNWSNTNRNFDSNRNLSSNRNFNSDRNFNRGTGSLRHSNGNWRHRHFRNRIIFVSSFGFPWYYPWSYGYPYSYDYSPYGYSPYGYSPYGYSPYGSYENGAYQGGGTYDDSTYDGTDAGYYGGPRYGRGTAANRSTVAQVQRALAREGYYKGEIDGIMGSRTHYAIRAYQRTHDLRVDGAINEQLLERMARR